MKNERLIGGNIPTIALNFAGEPKRGLPGKSILKGRILMTHTKKLLALLLTLCLLTGLTCASAEDAGSSLLDTVMTELEKAGEAPTEDSITGLYADLESAEEVGKTYINATRLYNLGFSYYQLFSSTAYSMLPLAAASMDCAAYLGYTPDTRIHMILGQKFYTDAGQQAVLFILLDYHTDRVYTLSWAPYARTANLVLYQTGIDSFTNRYINTLAEMDFATHEELAPYYRSIRNSSTTPAPTATPAPSLSVGSVKWSISADKKSVYMDKPTISGGVKPYRIAYNCYDENSNPVNYYYSDESKTAMTPGYNGRFNVFVVVTDAAQHTKQVNTGWFSLTGYEPLTVKEEVAVSEISADKRSIYINQPTVSGGTGNYTFAYNCYDENSEPVNYYYSDEKRTAMTPGYAGKFCVFVVVSDGNESITINTGWYQLKK